RRRKERREMKFLTPMRNLLFATSLLGGLALTGLIPAAQARQGGNENAYIWTYQYTKGTTVRLRGRLDLSGDFKQNTPDGKEVTEAVNVVIRSVNKQEVKSVSANGEATVQDTTEQYEILLNGVPPPHDKPLPVTYTFSKTGQVLKKAITKDKKSGVPDPRVEALGFLLNEMLAPDKPIKVGDTWKTELNNRFVEGQKVTQTSTLVGMEKVVGIDALKVKVQMSVPFKPDAGEKETLKLEGAYYVDPKGGRKIRTDLDVD